MDKQHSSMSPKDWREFGRFLQKKAGREVYLLSGETFDDMHKRIQGIFEGSFLRRIPFEIREENGRYFLWLTWERRC